MVTGKRGGKGSEKPVGKTRRSTVLYLVIQNPAGRATSEDHSGAALNMLELPSKIHVFKESYTKKSCNDNSFNRWQHFGHCFPQATDMMFCIPNLLCLYYFHIFNF